MIPAVFEVHLPSLSHSLSHQLIIINVFNFNYLSVPQRFQSR
jgi:hypothetical protein